MASQGFDRLVRFKPQSDKYLTLIGEPTSPDQDVGLATYNNERVEINVYSGASILDPGQPTGKIEIVERLLSPLAQSEVGTIRCLGLNYEQHARESQMPTPTIPTIFMKPSTALTSPHPTPVPLPRFPNTPNTADYESELAIIIGRRCRDVPVEKALEHVLGYTAANDISHRESQFATSQWSHSKSFDCACPLGPAVASTRRIPDARELRIKGCKNGIVKQECGCDDLIFGVGELVSFLSGGTTLMPGTVILTGTPAGVGFARRPQEWLVEGDVFGVEVLPGVGTLVSGFVDMKPPKGPFKLVTVNTAPERAKRLVGRVADNLAGEYTMEHVDNCESIEEVKPKFERWMPDMMFTASMFTPTASAEIINLAKQIVPDVRAHAIPYGMQVERGPEYVIEYLSGVVPGMLGGRL